jgi:putative ABC transport system permease protein
MWFRKRRTREKELAEELQTHLEMAVSERIDRGEAPDSAAAAAHREFGNIGLIKEVTREKWGGASLERLVRDAAYGCRLLRKNPGFTVVAVLTLALGIGATTAIFSVIQAVLLRSLPYPEADRLVLIHESLPSGSAMNVAWPDFVDWQTQNGVFEQMAAFRADTLNMIDKAGKPKTLHICWVSASFFSVLRAKPVLGRPFGDEADRPGGEASVVLGYRFWQRELNGDLDAAAKTLAIEGDAVPIAAVMPPDSKDMPWNADAYAPIGPLSTQPNFTARDNHPGIQVVARMRPGITLAQARSEMDAIMTRLSDQYPASNRGETALLTPLNRWVVGDFRIELLLLAAAVGLVLLLACANVAHLLLGRAVYRAREFGIRLALGAGPVRLTRQLMIESLILSLLGGSTGIGLAYWGIPMLVRLSPYSIPRLDEAGIDLTVMVFTFGISMLTGIIFGLAPALQAVKVDVVNSLKGGPSAARSDRSRASLRSALTVAEVAISVLVVTGSGLLVRSMVRLLDVSAGFQVDHLLTVEMVRRSGANESPQDFFAEAVGRVSHLPGVESASAVMCAPLTGIRWTSPFMVEGQAAPSPSERPQTVLNMVWPEYFQTIKAGLVDGRHFDERDGSNSPAVAIVNETLARRIAPGESVVGKHVHVASAWREIVGVVADVKQLNLTVPALGETFLPIAQQPLNFATVVVRTAGNRNDLSHAVTDAIQSLDGSQSVQQAIAMSDTLALTLAPRTFPTVLLGLFSVLAMALAALGVYGVTSYQVAQRTREIGVRMGLGATARDVVRLMMRQGMVLVMMGAGLGLAAAFGLTRLMSSLLFGVSPTDLTTFLVAPIALAVVAILATYLPARRASRIEPVDALRCD